MKLDKQFGLYSIDTSYMYTETEKKYAISSSRYNKKIKQINYILKNADKNNLSENNKEYYINKKSIYTKIKNGYKRILAKEIKKNQPLQRVINRELKNKDKIAMFESSLSRIINVAESEFTNDLIILRVYYYEIFESLSKQGFLYNGEKYVLWSASAGQIRQKKCVFVKERVLEKYYNTIYCGLTLDRINKPRIKVKDGEEIEEIGCNKNKYLAYTSLVSTASDKWDDFDIDKCIVVDDFETIVNGLVDFIDHTEFDNEGLWKITRENRNISIPTMDGCGLSLNYTGMCRLPWIKGLLGEINFVNIINENPHIPNVGIIKDIYGVKHDIIKENIQIIFTKSQFKMWKYYNSWEEYKDNFKKYKCEACKCNDDIVKYKKSTISYQPLQSLFEITDGEIKNLVSDTNYKIKEMCNNRDKALNVLGAVEDNENKNYYQQGLFLYPEMLSDIYSKKILKDTKRSITQKAKYGKILIDGCYTFIMPDLYAFCEHLLLHIDKPKGLLKRGEVSCRLFKDGEELDMVRSPHLNFSHCINVNKVNNLTEKHFVSNAIYVACDSLDSLEMMNDVDGDTSLVIRNRVIINSAKRIRKKYNIVPLYYELKKAQDDIINNNTLYQGMVAAYSGGNIGEVSNSITKVWNNKVVGANELKAISYLTLWNNVIIDYAKTLWKPYKTKEMDLFLKQYTSKKLPRFFMHIKDKKKTKATVEEINDSVINRISNLIESPKLNLSISNCGRFNYKKLMSNTEVDIDTILAKNIIGKFLHIETQRTKVQNNHDFEIDKDYSRFDSRKKMELLNKNLFYIVDVLVKYYYTYKIDEKRNLWEIFGDVIVENIQSNLDLSEIQCAECGKRFDPDTKYDLFCERCANTDNAKTKNIKCEDCGAKVIVNTLNTKTCRCEKCQKIKNRILEREKKRRQRSKKM